MNWYGDELETVPCDLCGGTESRYVYTRPDGLKAVECASCGLCFLNPRPPSHLLSRLYEDDYYTAPHQASRRGTVGYRDYVSHSIGDVAREVTALRLGVVSRYIPIKGRDCVEIGCATGEMCEALRRRGARVVGLDIARCAIEEASQRYPAVQFQQGDVSSLGGSATYDAVFAFEVIEHTPSPREFLCAAASLLKPGGFLVLTTPNYDCGKAIGPERWVGLLTSMEHLFFLSRSTAGRLAEAAGLTVVEWLTGRGTGCVTVEGEPTPAPLPRQLVRAGLERLGLLSLARHARRRLGCHPAAYVCGGVGHNLCLVMRRA